MRMLALGLVVSIGMAQVGDQTLRTTSRLVQLNVVVHDSKGAPIRDLTKDDFVVLDEGRERKVGLFQMEEERGATTEATTAHPLTLNNRSVKQAELPASATIILIDSLNMRSMDDLLYVKRELPKFLKHLQPGDPVAIYTMAGPAVWVMHEFSDNTESLLHAAERGSSVLGQWLGSAEGGRAAGASESHIKAEWTLSALESIALHLADIPGRKTLVWVSSAFPLTIGFSNTEGLANGAAFPKNGDLEPYYERLRRLGRIFNRVDLAVYPVDPKGLAVEDQYNAGATKSQVRNPRLRTEGENRAGEFATMDLIALETGGHAFYNANALGQSIQRAVDDSRVTYVLGFYPDEASWDGKYHRLEVRVNRPGAQVRSRRSYFASDAHTESAPEREAALRTVAATALNGTAIGVTVKVAANPLKLGTQQIEISVDPRDVQFENKDGKWRADFDLIVSSQAPDGRRLAGERSQCVVDRMSYSETQSKELRFERTVVVEPQAASLRVLVRDAASGAVGSLAVPVSQGRK